MFIVFLYFPLFIPTLRFSPPQYLPTWKASISCAAKVKTSSSPHPPLTPLCARHASLFLDDSDCGPRLTSPTSTSSLNQSLPSRPSLSQSLQGEGSDVISSAYSSSRWPPTTRPKNTNFNYLLNLFILAFAKIDTDICTHSTHRQPTWTERFQLKHTQDLTRCKSSASA